MDLPLDSYALSQYAPPQANRHMQCTNGPIASLTCIAHNTNVAGGSLVDVPAVAQGDPTAWRHPGPRQKRGVRGRLQNALETNSALSAYACMQSCGYLLKCPLVVVVVG